jgi:prepilin-type N-terminal cleavage/methylation domain-containing protein
MNRMNRMNRMNTSAFSLVELSIVLVILGLLTGGILTGQSLIKAAELRAISTEYNNYVSAIYTFRSKYFALPGDMSNAEDFWGTMATGTCPDATAGTGTQTCNGDGDGEVTQNAAADGQSSEGYQFWKQLSNAGLIEGNYTGVSGAEGREDDELNENVPASRWARAGWNIEDNVGGGQFAVSHGDNYFDFGADDETGDSDGNVIAPEDAWNVDKKIDDGRPAFGRLLSSWEHNCTTASGDTETDAEYNFIETRERCRLFFKIP